LDVTRCMDRIEMCMAVGEDGTGGVKCLM